MKNIQTILLFLFAFMPALVDAQFVNFEKSFNWNVFTELNIGGGGSVKLTVDNNILSLNFNAGFATSKLKSGFVTNTTYPGILPDTEIPIPSNHFFSDKGYRFYIENNAIYILWTNPVALSSFSGTLSINLNAPQPIPQPDPGEYDAFSQNFIQITDYLSPLGETSEKRVSIVYFDGLGRELQRIQKKQTPSQKDLVTPIEYDAYGRQAKDHLPIPTDRNTGLRVNPQKLALASNVTYGNEPAFYERGYEDSPRDLVIITGSPGNTWKIGGGHEKRFAYEHNELSDAVKSFKITSSQATDIYLSNLSFNGFYPVGALQKVVTKDENWSPIQPLKHIVITFLDKAGRLHLKREYSTTVPMDTYYLYDEFGNLTFVIPPKASELTKSQVTGTFSQAILDELIYHHYYDTRDRLVEQKMPGQGTKYFIYDLQNRLIMTQDSNQKALGLWFFNKFDSDSRLVYSGFTNSGSNTRVQVQNAANAALSQGDQVERVSSTPLLSNGFSVYYTNTVFPTNIYSLLSVNYFDTYPPGTPTVPSVI
ncbi:DUF6443 domain-containing protein, partial [Chryseobacterium sp. A321]